MEKVDKKKLLLYVFTLLKNEKFKHWNDDVLELDSNILKDLIDKNDVYFKFKILKPIIETLNIAIQTSKILDKELTIDGFFELCHKTDKLDLTYIYSFIDDDTYEQLESFIILDILDNIKEIILYSIFEYVHEFYKFCEMEIDSFSLFDENLFYIIQTQS